MVKRKLTQAAVDRMPSASHPVGSTVTDGEVPGLRVVVGRKSSTYRLVDRVKGSKAITVTIARTNEVSLAAARDQARELKVKMRQGIDPRLSASAVPTLREAGEAYLERKAGSLRPRTLQGYEEHLRVVLEPLLATRIDAITPAMADRLHQRISKKNGEYRANGAMRTLRAVLNFAAKVHDLSVNPVTRGVSFNKEKARDWALSRDEVRQFWLCLDGIDAVRRAAWSTLALTGLRLNEVRALRWDDIDADCVATIASPKGGPDRSFRTPLPSRLMEILGEIQFESDAELCFPSFPRGQGAVTLKRCTAVPFSPHQLRHTFRTTALEAGVDFQSVQLLMNHKLPGVSGNYVSRDRLMDHLREQVELGGRGPPFRLKSPLGCLTRPPDRSTAAGRTILSR